jgi:hypothetical protein
VTTYELVLRIDMNTLYAPDDDEDSIEAACEPVGPPRLDLDDPTIVEFVENLMEIGAVKDISDVVYTSSGEELVEFLIHVDEEFVQEFMSLGVSHTLGLASDVEITGIRQVTSDTSTAVLTPARTAPPAIPNPSRLLLA